MFLLLCGVVFVITFLVSLYLCGRQGYDADKSLFLASICAISWFIVVPIYVLQFIVNYVVELGYKHRKE